MSVIEPGSRIEARTADNRTIQRRALSGVVDGLDFPVVWLCTDEEWEAAQRDGRDPNVVPWPAEDVQLVQEAVHA